MNTENKEKFERRLKNTTFVLYALGVLCVASPILHLTFHNGITLALMGVSGLVVIAMIFWFLLTLYAIAKESGMVEFVSFAIRWTLYGIKYKIGLFFVKLFEKRPG